MNIHCHLSQMYAGRVFLHLGLIYQNNKHHLKNPECDSFHIWRCSDEVDIFHTGVFKIYLFKSLFCYETLFQKGKLLLPQ